VIGPAGVFVIDSKQYRGRLKLDPTGRLWHGRYSSPRTAGGVVRGRSGRSGPARPGRGRAAGRAVHGAQVPWARWSCRACRVALDLAAGGQARVP
jgi:hypothetical protein